MISKLTKFTAVYRAGGFPSLARRLGRSLVSSLWDYHAQEVRGRLILDKDPAFSGREADSHQATECVFVETVEELDRYAGEFRLPFRDSLDALRKRLKQGCFLILARQVVESGGREIVGYSIMERGGFSAAGIKGRLPQDTSFVHFTEVANKYRGQRIAQVITQARNEYCRRNGIKKSFTAHTTGNASSERAFRKFGSQLLCYAVRISILRGLIVWQTPWKRIERAMAKLDQSSKFEVRGSKSVGQAKVKAKVE